MSRRVIGPMSELAHITEDLTDKSTEDTLLTRMYEVNAALAANGCNCNGSHNDELGAPRDEGERGEDEGDRGPIVVNHQRDPYWGDDLSEFIIRAIPHEIQEADGDDPTLKTKTVALKLATLQAEVDDNNEIMAWLYEESEVTP